jgi:hypothetical protein
MISAWTKHLKTEDEKTRFKNEVLGSKRVLQRLQDLLKEVEDSADSIENDPTKYDSPGWAYRQADRNGFRRALKAVNKLITVDHD